MAIVINTNVSALLAQNYLTSNQAGLTKAMQRLSSGLRINNAADDPAGMAIAVSMGQTSSSLSQGAQNGLNGVSLVQTAQSAMNNISNILQQMSTLASQAATGTYSSTQLGNLNTTFQALLDEIERVAQSTQFNGIDLLNGTTSSITIQVGANNTSNDRLTITLEELTTGSSGLNIASLDISTNSGAQTAIDTLQTAVSSVTTALAQVGANEVNLTAAVSNNNALVASLDAAKSRVQDADYASESSMLAKFNILTQSNIAMLAQANALPGMALQLLRS
ncbi:flagellin N-terminal helical domain-containing protein [Aquicella lusitana]|uniref:Flagellin n=1 Tax=Aquicella lusitana TaxID=254246 RepID=A0A370G9S8_9COXI|nr:flagellin [Aquicella lusitana]RDI39950.1 flagellin [Aquicella lusitana]VVC74553.1 Flagellin [Aquicella lusitana]